MKLCSCVIPCYNEESAIPYYYREMLGIMEQLKEELEFELVFIDDGSSDGTLEMLQQL